MKTVRIDTTSGFPIVKITRHKNFFKGTVKLLNGSWEPLTLDCISPLEVKYQAIRVLQHSIVGEGIITMDRITWE